MKTQNAVVLQGDNRVTYVSDRRIPQSRPGYIHVDVKAVALNPADWKHTDLYNTPDCILGCDYAGVVAMTGSGYGKQWEVGDRVCGFVHGANSLQPEDGAFAEKIVVKADIQMRIPDSISFEEAATLGVAVITCGQGLYQSLKLSFPDEPLARKESILIYGGSTAMGTIGIQLAKLSGYEVLTTSSPHNFEMLKSLGADAVFDYKDLHCAAKVRDYAGNKLRLAWDCIAFENSAAICADSLVSGGEYGCLLQVQSPRDDIHTKYTLGYTCVGDPIQKPFLESKDNSADFEFMKNFISRIQPILDQGKLKPHPQKVIQGLQHVIEGMDLLKNNSVSGQKLVYTL